MKKLAIVGCGKRAENHLDDLITFKDIKLCGFCDIVPERADNFAQIAGGGRAFADFREMYDAVKPDMVCVYVPQYARGDIEFETIERGIHMFTEKPLALDLSLAVKIRDKAEKSGIITSVGLQCRYVHNINDATREFIAKNKIVTVAGSRVGGVPAGLWYRKKELSGGQLVDQVIHQFDMLRYFLGEPDTVYTIANRGFIEDAECPGYNLDDVSTTAIRFKNGVLCCFTAGCYSLQDASWDTKVTYGARNARLDYKQLTSVDIYEGSDKHAARTVKSIQNVSGICDRAFVDAVISSDRSKILSPYADAVNSLAMVLACNESIETGKPVKVGANL